MIEIPKEVLVILALGSFLAGILISASIVLAFKLKNISQRLKGLADKMGGGK